ncbi:MAG: 50S ribosomal protein L24 [Pseudomonadota bacterium]
MIKKFRIRTGDMVIVTSGKYAGQSGKITRVDRDKNRVAIDGIALRVKYVRNGQNSEKTQKSYNSLIHISNVAIKDPKTGKPTKIGYKFDENNKKIRIAKVSGEAI